MTIRPLALSLTAVLGILALDAGCSAPVEADDGSSNAGQDALTAADDDFKLLLPVLQQKLEDRRQATGSGQVGTSSLDILGVKPIDLSATKDACAALGASLRGRKELPIFFAFGGVSASVSAIAEFTVDAETVWDITHQQQAVFVGREYAITPGINVGAGIYAGLGLIDVDRMKKHGEEAPANVIE
ncbi:MAG TPA: hypothetical protein VLT33_45110, partial [Labilithrix sp.]|nr:hypothetical protein [Labilithrix sp.]